MTRLIAATDRLLSRCIDVDGCWVFTGTPDKGGYARVHVGPGDRMQYGHRLTWERFVAPWPVGLTYDHLCRRPACVNPWHGDPVPIGVNVHRAPRSQAAINAAKTHCPQLHPLSGDNLYLAPDGARRCAACRHDAVGRYRARRTPTAVSA
jgi:hypothetical protein